MKRQYLNIKRIAKRKAFAFLLSAFSLLAGCKKFVEIPPPTTQIVSTTVFNNNATATSAQLAIYDQMWNNYESFNLANNLGQYADELKNYQTSTVQLELYNNSLQAVNNPGPWVNYYYYLFFANSVINGLHTVSGTSLSVKNQLLGEAEFTRAFLLFYLTNIYGDVPIVLTTNPNINGKIARSPRIQVLQQVVTDLQSAKSLLNSQYVDGSDTLVTTERVRPNKAVALALLARAYLYLGDYSKDPGSPYYAKADSAATAVINNTNEYSLCPSLNSVFLKNSTEAIWQWQTPSNEQFDTPDGANFILLGAPINSSQGGQTISSQLLKAFEVGDQRKTNWIDSIAEGTATYYFPYKYKNYAYVGTEYTMVLRLGEQYLIRAEAEAREGKLPQAQSDLDMIRNRAGLPNISNTIAASQSDLLLAILHERQVELFTEWGHRWFDLQRAVSSHLSTNAGTVLGSPGNVSKAKGGTWNSDNYQLLFPIPQSDILTDHNLTQNPGY